ncbi:MAG TPA: hypothetical protein VJS88_09010 [Chthoniobacterales bacterium]|nr:hypothetical protein [Chthoniobacterales bacterium]
MNVAIGALGFVLTCAGLNTLLSSPETDRIVPNLKFFREHRHEFDTLFIGSSHVHHQIAPAVFDRTMRAAGHPTRSFNLGLNGMLPPENFYVLDQILKTKPRNLKWVFVELSELETKGERTQRALYWHDWKRTALVLRAVLEAGPEEGAVTLFQRIWEVLCSRAATSERRNLLFLHSVLFAENFANVGEREDLVRWVRPLWKKGRLSKDIGPNRDGYIPINRETMATQPMPDEASLQRRAGTETRFLSALTASAYRQLADDVRRSGAVPIFLVTPDGGQSRLGFRPESGIAATVFAFNNAKDYPELYRKEMRVDSDHLNGAGSEYFTRLLAQTFLQSVYQDRVR